MLTQMQVERARKRSGPYKLGDRDGLYLYVSPTGAKSWRYDFRFPASASGTRYTLVHGRFEAGRGLTLADAREKQAEARRHLREGRNPAILKQETKRAAEAVDQSTFKTAAEDWYSDNRAGKSASWIENTRRWLEDRIYPKLGARQMASISDVEILALCRGIQREGKHRTAAYVRRLIAEVFTYAMPNSPNPAAAIRGKVKPPKPESHARLSERELPAFLKKADALEGNPFARLGVKLLALTFTRKRELTGAGWVELDLDAAEWRIPAGRMKSKREHLVPLSAQAVETFRELQKLSGDSEWVFPSPYKPKQPVGRELLNKAFRAMGYEEFTPHGIRATASTILNDRSGFPGDVIEACLAHVERDKVRAAYNYAQWLEQRRKVMQFWADTLDSLRSGGKVVPIRPGRAA